MRSIATPAALASIDADDRFRGAIATDVIDLEADAVSLGQSVYGAILVFNYLHRPLMPVLIDALAPGGVLIYETFTRGQAARGHPRNPAFLLDDGELPRLVRPLEVVRSFEGERDGNLIASVVAPSLARCWWASPCSPPANQWSSARSRAIRRRASIN